MPSAPSECAKPTSADTLAPTCNFELSSGAVPSILYQCTGGTAVLSSVMVNATDPETGITFPDKLQPGKGCNDICKFYLGDSGLTVGHISINESSIQIGDTDFTPDPFTCQQ